MYGRSPNSSIPMDEKEAVEPFVAMTAAAPMTPVVSPLTPGQTPTFPQQSPIPQQYPGANPQQQHSHPVQFMVHPGQQPGIIAPDQHNGVTPSGTNAVQAAPKPATVSQYRVAAPIAALGRSSAPVDCPGCGQRSLTSTNFLVGNTTHGWAAALCCLLCVGCIPYIMNDTKDVEHKCGQCGISLATWHRSGTTDVHLHS